MQPYETLILVAYFLFKCSVEWAQCSAARRSLRVSRIDLISAWIVSLVAYALYVVQAISRIQFADLLDAPRSSSLYYGLLSGITISMVLYFCLRYKFANSSLFSVPQLVGLCVVSIASMSVTGVALSFMNGLRWGLLVIGVVTGSGLFSAILAVVWWPKLRTRFHKTQARVEANPPPR